jgi:hypothetical protein
VFLLIEYPDESHHETCIFCLTDHILFTLRMVYISPGEAQFGICGAIISIQIRWEKKSTKRINRGIK